PDQSRYREASLEILARDGEPLRVFTTRDGMLRLATLPDDVDPHYLNLLLQVEDRRFWRHPGVDPLALARAVWQLIRHGHVVSGGSTLTMQVARLLSPHRHDVVGKLTDIARAMQLEARFTKREILAMYLTLGAHGRQSGRSSISLADIFRSGARPFEPGAGSSARRYSTESKSTST